MGVESHTALGKAHCEASNGARPAAPHQPNGTSS